MQFGHGNEPGQESARVLESHPRPKKLYEKLLEVQKAIASIAKTHTNSMYSYASSSDVLGPIRKELLANNLLVVPNIKKTVITAKDTPKGSTRYFTEIWYTLTWVNGDNPEETLTIDWYSQGQDEGEKGIGKALTYGEKYFFLKFFNIPTDDADPEASDKKRIFKHIEQTTPTPQPEPTKQLLTGRQRNLLEKLNAPKEYNGKPLQQLTIREASELIQEIQIKGPL